MAIIQTIDNASQFRDEFYRCGRGDQFSYEGLGILFDYLDDMGEDVELDVVGICCDYSEDSWDQITTNYSFDIDSLDGLEEEEKIAEKFSIREKKEHFINDDIKIVIRVAQGASFYHFIYDFLGTVVTCPKKRNQTFI